MMNAKESVAAYCKAQSDINKIDKMNEEQTFQFGPFEVTVFPATNEEDEWVEVEES